MTWLFLAFIILSLALGCRQQVLTQWPQPKIFSTYFREKEVKLGMSREEVEGSMGPPQVKEEGDFRGGHYVLYFYRTHNMDYANSDTVRGGYTPLVFQNNRLVGKGKRDYQKAVDRSAYEYMSPPSRSPTQTIYPKRTW